VASSHFFDGFVRVRTGIQAPPRSKARDVKVWSAECGGEEVIQRGYVCDVDRGIRRSPGRKTGDRGRPVRNIKPCLRENVVLELSSWLESERFWHRCSGLRSVRHDANRAGRALGVHRVAGDRLCRCHPQPQRTAQPNRPSRPRLPG